MLRHTLLLLLFAQAAMAGELMVHPTRVVFDGNSRTAQIDVINSGTETMTYRISLIRRRMTDTGEFVPVSGALAEERFADEMIRFSPRQVVLPPGGAQAVRLQLRKPAALEDGEYRSHLLFQALPSAAEGGKPPCAEQDRQDCLSSTSELEIQLIAVYSVSIPLIVRQGATSAEVTIRDLALSGGAATFVLDRKGTRSVYGDLVVTLRGARGVERVLARANGVAVYTPNLSRRVRIPIPAQALPLPEAELRVAFVERAEQPGRIAAESRVALR